MEETGFTDDDDRAPADDVSRETDDDLEPEPDPEPDPEQDPPAGEEDPPASDDIRALRSESAKHRKQRNEERDRAAGLERRLFQAMVEQTGMLVDARDMPFDAALLEDDDTLRGAVEAYAEDRPHLKARSFPREFGPDRGDAGGSETLAGILRRNA